MRRLRIAEMLCLWGVCIALCGCSTSEERLQLAQDAGVSYHWVSAPRDFYHSQVWTPLMEDDLTIGERVQEVYSDLNYLELALWRYTSMNSVLNPVADWLIDGATNERRQSWLVACAELRLGDGNLFQAVKNDPERIKQALRSQRLLVGSSAVMDNFRTILPFVDEPVDPRGCAHPRTLDPFSNYNDFYGYTTQVKPGRGILDWYLFTSVGPDGDRDLDLTTLDSLPPRHGMERNLVTYRYDPTNGIVSDGDIFFYYSDTDTPTWK